MLTIQMVPKVTVAAELLALAPDVPEEMSTTEVAEAIVAVIDAHASLGDCIAELAQEYGDHPEATAARMARCLAHAARWMEEVRS